MVFGLACCVNVSVLVYGCDKKVTGHGMNPVLSVFYDLIPGPLRSAVPVPPSRWWCYPTDPHSLFCFWSSSTTFAGLMILTAPQESMMSY